MIGVICVASVGLLSYIMGFFMRPIILFSRIEGKVVSNGQPVVGAVVERSFTWAWNGHKGQDQTITDIKGDFSFGAIKDKDFFASFLPHEINIAQLIVIKYSGNAYKAWVYDKSNYLENGELGGRAIKLSCHLESTAQKRGEVFGIADIE